MQVLRAVDSAIATENVGSTLVEADRKSTLDKFGLVTLQCHSLNVTAIDREPTLLFRINNLPSRTAELRSNMAALHVWY